MVRTANSPPGFAATPDGLDVAALHLTGVPLAATQADATPTQLAFLVEAVPRARSAAAGSATTTPAAPDARHRQPGVEQARTAVAAAARRSRNEEG